MKRLVILLAVLSALLILSPAAQAADVEAAQREALGTDRLEKAVPGSAGEEMGRLTVDDALDLDRCLEALGRVLREGLGGAVKSAVSSAAVIVAAVALSAAAGVFLPDQGRYAPILCVVAVAAVAVRDSASLTSLGRSTMEELNAFSKMLLPTLAAAAAAGGAAVSAPAKYAASVFFIDLLISGSGRLVLPLIYAYIAASVASAAFGSDGLRGACALLKWAAVTVMTVTVLAFTAYLSLTGIISGNVDAAAARAARTAISTALPVVGGMIADASSAVLAGAAMLRGAVGVFGLVAVAAAGLTPFLRIGAHYLLYKAAAGVSGAVAEPETGRLLSALSSAFGMLLGLVGATVLMLFISVISVMRAVTG